MQNRLRQDLAFLLEDFFLLQDDAAIIASVHEILLRLRGEYVLLSQRFKILEEITSKIDDRAVRLRQAILKEQNSFTQKRQESREIDNAQQAVASAYVSVFSDHQMLDDDGALDMTMIATAMHRALYHLQQLQLWHYQLFSPLPDRLWFNIHLVYREAMAYQLDTYPLVLTTSSGSHKTTLEESYKRALLFGSANTSCMAPEEMVALYCFLEQWAQHAVLRQQGNRADIYSIYIFSDQGPVYQSLKTPRPREKETWRTLDTSSLVEVLRKLYERMESQNQDYLTVNFHRISRQNISRLINTWGTMPHRRFTRVPDQSKIQLCFNAVEAETAHMYSLTRDYSQAESWDTLNTSPNGFCLTKRGELTHSVFAGMLVRVQETSQDAQLRLFLGEVRWLKHLTQEGEPEVVMGVQLLSPKFEEIELTRNNTIASGWYLPPVEEIKQQASLVVPPKFALGDVLDIKYLEQHKEHEKVKLTVCVEFSNYFLRYQFEVL